MDRPLVVALGGCLCGAVRYRISGDLAGADVVYCHCAACRRASGAPVMAWVSFPAAAIWIERGQPLSHAASARAIRQFCPSCGTPLFFGYTEGTAELDVSLGSIDCPQRFGPQRHIWTAERLEWFETTDRLPRHPQDEPGSGVSIQPATQPATSARRSRFG